MSVKYHRAKLDDNNFVLEYTIMQHKFNEEWDSKELIFDSEAETISFAGDPHQFNEVYKQARIYAQAHNLTYIPPSHIDTDSVTFKPFYTVMRYPDNKIHQKTQIQVHTINYKGDELHLMHDIETFEKLKNLKYWSYAYVVKFHIEYNYIIGSNSQMRAVFRCLGILFKHKRIEYKSKDSISKIPYSMFEQHISER